VSTGEERSPRRIVAVLPDVSGIDRTFAYTVPDALSEQTRVGSIVWVPLQGRKVRGWVVAEGGVDQPQLRALDAVVSLGPSGDVVELCQIGAWRYAGRLRPFLLAASPPRLVHALAPRKRSAHLSLVDGADGQIVRATKESLRSGAAVLRIPPSGPRLDAVLAAIEYIAPLDVLVLVAEIREADVLSRRLKRLGLEIARYPDAWAQAAAGGRVVVGTRSAAFAPMPELGAIVVLDAHSEQYAEERAPTWDATTIARLRAQRAGVPCVLVSPCPPVTQLNATRVVGLARNTERAGWARVVVFDRREDDPRTGLYSSLLAETIRSERQRDPDRPFVCVLNRKGRALLLVCPRCQEIARCEHCGAAVHERLDDTTRTSELYCEVCGLTRPVICANCSSTTLARRRLGTERVAEELAALVGEPAVEVTRERRDVDFETVGVLVGTEAVLHRVRAASSVCFLDFDQELVAPRFRAHEEALALLARASRLVGGREVRGDRAATGSVFVQTRLPSHEVIVAAVNGDPAALAADEMTRRLELGLPPARAVATVEGDYDGAVRASLVRHGVEVGELPDGRLLVRAGGAADLAEALSKAGLPKEGMRVAVDPLRL
jgi:primosomal protein N' (replication factor Y) (superfamily II helicase)